MGLDLVPSGDDLPNDFNVVIEISMHSEPIKYEVDKESGAIFVDRFMSTAMHYPCNYGYIPHTIAGDGDPVDVLVLSQFGLPPGVVVHCRPIGVLKMADESGEDAKLLAVPVDRLTPMYRKIRGTHDLQQIVLDQIDVYKRQALTPPPESSSGLCTKTLFMKRADSSSAAAFWSKKTKGSILPTVRTRWSRASSLRPS